LGDRVIVRVVEGDEVSGGGIIIPDTAKEKPQKGEIVAAGPGALGKSGKRTRMQVKKGNKVLFGKYTGTEVTLDGEKLLIMRENDILAVL
jgi:chaperonin GroES